MATQYTRWQKITAFWLLLLFGSSDFFIPVPSALAFSTLTHSGMDSRILAENPFGIRLDERDGRVAGFFDGASDQPLVIQIEDAHANISAQKKTASIIRSIIEVKGKRGEGKGGREKGKGELALFSIFHY